jgi:hypothetical protein
MDTLQAIKAHEVAKKAHSGQIDKAGIDYIKHPETVTSFVATDEERAVIEKIEDMYDIKVADEAYKKWVECGKKTISHEEMMRRYG